MAPTVATIGALRWFTPGFASYSDRSSTHSGLFIFSLGALEMPFQLRDGARVNHALSRESHVSITSCQTVLV